MGGHPSCTRNANDQKQIQCSPEGWEAPQLSEALLHATAGQLPVFQTKLETKGTQINPGTVAQGGLKDLLDHIQERLDKGLTEAWISAQGYDYVSVTSFKDELKKLAYADAGAATKSVKDLIDKTWDVAKVWNDPEEQWARAISELFMFAAYGRPDLLYGVKSDEPIYSKFPASYSVMTACQHFSTYAILSRGFTLDQVRIGKIVGCSCSASTVSFACFARKDTSPDLSTKPETAAAWAKAEADYKADYEAWNLKSKAYQEGVKANASPLPDKPGAAPSHGKYAYPKQTQAPAFSSIATLLADPLKITPGSVVTYNPGGSGSTYQDLGTYTHIGTALRIAGSRIQFMDTGVMIGHGDAPSEGGTADHTFTTGSVAHSEHVVGVGVLSPPGDLTGATAAMAKSRPLGLVRLVVVDTTKESEPRVCFVSKLVHMRYPVSRLMWSLSNLPVEQLSVLWLVYAPQGLSDALGLGDKPVDTDTLLTTPPSKLGTSPRLALTHVLRGNAGVNKRPGDVMVYRLKTGATARGYNKNFSVTEPPPAPAVEMGLGYPLITSVTKGAQQPKLGAWSETWQNADKSFLQLDSTSPGTTDPKADYPDVAFFK